MGTVVLFPLRRVRAFTPEMRDTLLQFAAGTPSAAPATFGADDSGAEFCRFGNGLMIGWDQRRNLMLTDTLTGYIDHGPFRSVDEICLLITYLAG